MQCISISINRGKKMRSFKDFPINIKAHAWAIYPRKKIVSVDGFKVFELKELRKIPLNTRLSFPPILFKAINKA